MRDKLIATLNQLQHLNPDEIVSALSDGGWIQGNDFDRTRYDRWTGRQCKVWFYPGRDRPAHAGDCGTHVFAWSFGTNGKGIDGLNTYYFILLDNFTGEFPNVD